MLSPSFVRTSVCVATLALFATAVGWTPDVWAQSSRLEVSGDAALSVQLSKLELSRNSGIMSVTYDVSQGSWAKLKRAGIVPTLAFYLPKKQSASVYEYTYSVPLKSKKGAFKLPKMDLAGVQKIEVSLVGLKGPYRVATTGVGKSKATSGRILVSVRNLSPKTSAEVVKACMRNLRSRANDVACASFTKKMNRKMVVEIIDACGAATDADNGMLACLTGVQSLKYGREPEIVTACATHTRGDADLFRCVKFASKVRKKPDAAVNTCGKSTSQIAEMAQCLSLLK